jgi:hypothetical protein
LELHAGGWGEVTVGWIKLVCDGVVTGGGKVRRGERDTEKREREMLRGLQLLYSL